MSVRRLAWGLVIIAGACMATGTAVSVGGGAEQDPVGDAIFAVLLVVFGVVGALVASGRPANPIGWIFVAVAVGLGVVGLIQGLGERVAAGGDTTAFVARLGEWLEGWTWVPLVFVPTTFPLLLFPDGHPPSPRWRVLVWAAGIGTAGFSFGMAFDPENFGGGPIPLGVEPPSVMVDVLSAGSLLLLPAVVGGVAAVVVRFRRATGDERQQMRWLAYVGGVAGIVLVGSFVIGAIMSAAGAEFSSAVDEVLNAVLIAAILSIPASMGVAILKYHLYDLDVVIRKTVVFAVVVGLLIAVGGLAAWLAGVGVVPTLDRSPLLLLLLGIGYGLLAIPLYRVSTRIADRLVYGGRATPYEVLTEFSERVGETYSTEDVLPRMAQLLGEATGAAVARVWLRVDREFRPAASWPADAERASVVPASVDAFPTVARERGDLAVEVRHQGVLLGALTVAMPANDPMGPAKARIVHDLASQAGLVLRNVGLIEELRESRRRIVAAQDDRAKKLERDIHDGAQQQLVALMVKERLAASAVETDVARARALLEEVQAETNEALEDLRDLARGIYPPLLADRGLPAALEAQARKSPVPTTVESDRIERHPPEVESAVYFSCLEALQNVAKYSGASHASIRLRETGGELAFEILDDGAGFDPADTARGTGLQGMADRIAAIGGHLEVHSSAGAGTAVTGRLPTSLRQVMPS